MASVEMQFIPQGKDKEIDEHHAQARLPVYADDRTALGKYRKYAIGGKNRDRTDGRDNFTADLASRQRPLLDQGADAKAG